MPFVDLLPILIGWIIAISSPGPATMAIAGTSMEGGRARGLAVAWGVASGSVMWSLIAGLGLSAAMLANLWLVEGLRYAGALYLGYLAVKSARSAMRPGGLKAQASDAETLFSAWARGALVHMTNPKAVLFWGALFAVAVPAGSSGWVVFEVGAACLTTSFLTMTLMALAFSSRPVARAYIKARRWFEATFAVLFGFAAFKILTAQFA